MAKYRRESKKTTENQPIFIIEEAAGPVSENEQEIKIPKKVEQRNRSKKTIETIKRIYETDGETTDFTKLERGKRRHWPLLAGLIVFFAIIATSAWAGFFIFKPYGGFDGKGVELAIKGPDTVKAGEANSYDFVYSNTESVPIAALEIRLVIPKEFHITNVSIPPTIEPSTWKLGSMEKNGSGFITVKGYFLGPSGGQSAFQSIATFRPANFNSDFQSITTRNVSISGSVLEAIIDGPNETAPGETVTYQYKVKNKGTEPLDSLELELQKPDAFIFSSSEPASSNASLRWILGKLDPEAEAVVKIKGSFSTDAKGPTDIGFSIGARQNDDWLVQRNDIFSANVLASDLSLNLVVNGSSKDLNARFGDLLRVSLSYQNNGDRTMSDVTLSISAAATTALVDWQNVQMDVKGRVSNSTVTWTKKELKSLENISPNGEGTIDVTIPIVKEPPGAQGLDEIRISGGAFVAMVGGRQIARQIQTTPIAVSLNPDLDFRAEARYFDDDNAPLGTGPLPPKVGQTTNLRLIWTLDGGSHEFQNVRAFTILPPKVSWTGKTNADIGAVSWDAASRTVSWTIDKTTALSASLTADFEVGISPTADDVGKFVTLTNETSVTALDSKTQTTSSRRITSLTTEMPTDTAAAGKGVVVQ